MSKLNTFILTTIVFALSTLFLTNWGFQLSAEKKDILTENQQLSGQVKELDELKENLTKEVNELVTSYEKVTEEKKVLQELLNDKTAQLVKEEQNFQALKTDYNNTTLSLKETIQQLFQTKTDLEINIKETATVNDILLEEAGIDRATFEGIMNNSADKTLAFQALLAEYKVAQERAKELEIKNRVQKIRANLKPKEIYLQEFRATAFRVELEMRNGKATSKAKRVKNIKVSFDLKEIPKKYQNEQDLYLVVKNEKNELLTNEVEPTAINIGNNSASIKISQSRHLELEDSQRLRFNFEVLSKLKEGYYSVYIYAKDGLLGKTSFRVN